MLLLLSMVASLVAWRMAKRPKKGEGCGHSEVRESREGRVEGRASGRAEQSLEWTGGVWRVGTWRQGQGRTLARYSVSREVPCYILKWETVLGYLDATPKVP